MGNEGSRKSTQAQRIAVGEFLRYVAKENNRREQLEEQIARLRSSIDLGAVRYSDMPHAKGPRDKVADGVAKLLELQAQWAAECGDLARLYGEARAFCFETIPRRMVWEHYVEGKTWWFVAKRWGYSERGTYKISAYGIREIHAWMPEEFRRGAFPPAQPWD